MLYSLTVWALGTSQGLENPGITSLHDHPNTLFIMAYDYALV